MFTISSLFRKKSVIAKLHRANKYLPDMEALEQKEIMAVDIARFHIPVPPSGEFSSIQNLNLASDGQIWFVKNMYFDNNIMKNEICRISTTGKTTVVVPVSSLDSINIYDLIAGRDGNEWFIGSNIINPVSSESIVGKITQDGQITIFDLGSDIYANHITTGLDGSLWITAVSNNDSSTPNQGILIHVNQDGVISRIPLITTSDNLTLEGVASDRAGNIWVGSYLFANDNYKRVSILFCYSTKGVITQYSILPKRVVLNRDNKPVFRDNSVEVNSLTQGADGNVWFTTGAYSKNLPRSVWKVTPNHKFSRVTAFPIGVNGYPSGIISGKGHRLYFVVNDTNWDIPHPLFKIGVINTSMQIKFIRLQKTNTVSDDNKSFDPSVLAIGSDGNLWCNNWLSMIDSSSRTDIARIKLPKVSKIK